MKIVVALGAAHLETGYAAPCEMPNDGASGGM